MSKSIIFVLMFIMMFSLVMAQPPFEAQVLDVGLTLETIQTDSHEQDTEFYLHTHVYDSNTGLLLNDSIKCFYHMYSENVNWEHLITNGTLTLYGAGYSDLINESYFNETGKYVILLWCEYNEADVNKGGFVQYSFNVIDDETHSLQVWSCPAENKGFTPLVIVLGMAILFIILSFTMKESLFGIFGGLMIALSYLFIGACSPLLFMFLPVVGILIALWFGLS